MKKTALSQYLKNFKVGIILAVIALAVFVFALSKNLAGGDVKENKECNPERVFDTANVLTDAEEESLREFIADNEKKYKIHIVLVTLDLEVPYGQEYLAMNMADDFYDEGDYGYDKVHGDGFLLLDCVSETPGMSFSWLSTCGKVKDKFGPDSSEKYDKALEPMSKSNYSAYKATIQAAIEVYTGEVYTGGFMGSIASYIMMAAIGLICGLIYKAVNKSQAPAPVTTGKNTYTSSQPIVVRSRDDFLRKETTSRIIQSSSSGGSRSGGHHTSSHGVSHGGGGRRH